MKILLVLAFTFCFSLHAKANVGYINFSKISHDPKQIATFEKIKDNVEYYNHWSPQWNYSKDKKELALLLEQAYVTFSKSESQSIERHLLLGTLAHYLFNIEKEEYNSSAIENFTKAISLAPTDYRAYWFLGFHYSLSAAPDKSIDNLLKAKSLSKDQPAEFWENYATATYLTNMPSHSIYAMDKVKEITGQPGYFENQVGQRLRSNVLQLNKTKNYKKEELWVAEQGEKTTFVSRPFGTKISIQPNWEISVSDYNNQQATFVMYPFPLTNEKGRKINYSIALLMKAANVSDKLDNHINSLVSKYQNKTKINFSDKYENMVVYEIKDRNMYKEVGGAHLYIIGIERPAPQNPGMLLESPVSLPNGKLGQVNIYSAKPVNNRFEGKIFYTFLLDSCEDIHDQTLEVFKNLFENDLIIE